MRDTHQRQDSISGGWFFKESCPEDHFKELPSAPNAWQKGRAQSFQDLGKDHSRHWGRKMLRGGAEGGKGPEKVEHGEWVCKPRGGVRPCQPLPVAVVLR